MPSGCVLSDYMEHAMAAAVYDKLEDGSFAGRVPEVSRRGRVRRHFGRLPEPVALDL